MCLSLGADIPLINSKQSFKLTTRQDNTPDYVDFHIVLLVEIIEMWVKKVADSNALTKSVFFVCF